MKRMIWKATEKNCMNAVVAGALTGKPNRISISLQNLESRQYGVL